ncbi:EAL domain-containing protein [Pseudomonas aeruginosa]|uniref:EAL domain-containing protein n=1 Tax=Pseudomonas aeruginosa TaxID=287 RepID=UPI00138696FD|nr:EAL domain-containing protein [Pseudomonas aeruginosa]MBU8391363.1 EAL domain-containing protein [Pseudomonas aeruginosa]MCV4131058.1 EAL domain-containing protein [Pseudomonas aeruginosa]HCK4348555.1 EAL domain-containing protein [Pseudomonas aeruginosa]
MSRKEVVGAAKILKFKKSEVASDYYFYVSILNLKQVAISFGEERRIEAFHSLIDRLDNAGISRGKVKVLSASTILIDPNLVPYKELGSKSEFMLDVIYGEPLIIPGSGVVLSVELGRVKNSDLFLPECFDGLDLIDSFFTEVLIPPYVAVRGWKEAYLDEMEKSYNFYCRPFGESYRSMPISYLHSPELVLFDEVLVDSDLDLSSEVIFGALEFTGTVAYSEFRLFEKLIDVLSRDKISSISMNISSSNFYFNSWWEQVVDVLEKHPILARRVYFELTETQPLRLNRFRKERGLIESIKKTGAHLVLDDFGSGFTSFGCVDLLEPEVIKVDKSLLHDARNENRYYNILLSVVRYSMERCGFCVVEGVETENDLLIVESTGANLVQGKYLEKYSRVDF